MVRGGETSIPAAPARWARASTCSAPPTERARCAQPVWLLSALACCRPGGHQLDHYFVVDGDKIGSRKSGLVWLRYFSLILAARTRPRSGPEPQAVGSTERNGQFHGKPPGRTLTITAGQTIRSCLLLLVYDYLRSCFARLCCFSQQRQALIARSCRKNGRAGELVCTDLAARLQVSEHTIRRDLHEPAAKASVKSLRRGGVDLPEAETTVN